MEDRKNKMIKELDTINNSIKNIIELMDYEDIREYDGYYPFEKSLDEVLIDLIEYKNSFDKF